MVLSQEWNSDQIRTSFESAEYLQRHIQYNYSGGSSIHIGFLYFAVGKNHGQETSRYIIVIPFYDPSIHGYNFKVNNPFVYFRGFAGVSSTEFLDVLQDQWNTAVNKVPEGKGREKLSFCSPIAVYKFNGQNLDMLTYEQSNISPNDSLSIKDGFFEFWIHGPRNVSGADNPTDESVTRFQQLVQAENPSENLNALKELLEGCQKQCNSYSFPTFGLKVPNPMSGHLPFPVKDLRLQVGGIVDVTDDHSNDVHIKASISDIPQLVEFSRIWDKIFNKLPGDIQQLVKNHRLRQKLNKLLVKS